MTLEQFIGECRDDVDRFKAMWDANQTKQPEAFPGQMNEGDWFDQYLIFLQSNKR